MNVDTSVQIVTCYDRYKEPTGETFETLFGVNFSDCSERKNPFNSKLEDRDIYYYNTCSGTTDKHYAEDARDCINMSRINSFNDGDFANQIYLHELLNRKLLKYAYDNEAEDCEWSWNGKQHYYIFFDYTEPFFTIAHTAICKNQGTVYFSKEEVAKQAIRDVVEPFMIEYPEFIW